MSEKEITLHFEMDDDVQSRVYSALKNLPELYKETDLSKAVIMSINNLVSTVGECEKRSAKCEQLINSLLARQDDDKIKWS